MVVTLPPPKIRCPVATHSGKHIARGDTRDYNGKPTRIQGDFSDTLCQNVFQDFEIMSANIIGTITNVFQQISLKEMKLQELLDEANTHMHSLKLESNV